MRDYDCVRGTEKEFTQNAVNLETWMKERRNENYNSSGDRPATRPGSLKLSIAKENICLNIMTATLYGGLHFGYIEI